VVGRAGGLQGAKKAGVNNEPSAPQAVIIMHNQMVMRDFLVPERPETTIPAVMWPVARRGSMAHQKPIRYCKEIDHVDTGPGRNLWGCGRNLGLFWR